MGGCARLKRSVTAPLALAVALGACSSGSPAETTAQVATAIVGGQDDTGDSGVVALLRGGALVCTGVLIAPHVVLTAAHCVAFGAPDEVRFGSTLGVAASRPVWSAQANPAFDASTL